MNRAFTVEIEKMVYGGKGMGRVEGKVVFVPYTAPGERVEVEVVREKKDYAEASLKSGLPTSFVLPSEAVDRLGGAARKLVTDSPEFQLLLKELGSKIEAVPAAH